MPYSTTAQRLILSRADMSRQEQIAFIRKHGLVAFEALPSTRGSIRRTNIPPEEERRINIADYAVFKAVQDRNVRFLIGDVIQSKVNGQWITPPEAAKLAAEVDRVLTF